MDGAAAVAFWFAAGLAALGFFTGPIARGLGRWIESKSQPPGVPPELAGRLEELDQMQQRVGELEERLDFAERMLAQQRDSSRLGAGEQP